jgi:hypothetical protein
MVLPITREILGDACPITLGLEPVVSSKKPEKRVADLPPRFDFFQERFITAWHSHLVDALIGAGFAAHPFPLMIADPKE